MPGRRMDRRTVIRNGLLGGAAVMTGAPVFAQASGLIDQLGDKLENVLVKELNKVKLPDGPLNLVRTVALINELEQQANLRGLPLSPLSLDQAAPPLSPVDGTFYDGAMPRLVAIIDRAENHDADIADRAGSILADVHAEHHQVPDALKPAPQPMLRSFNFTVLKPEYARMFASLEAKPEHADTIKWHAKAIANAKDRYGKVADELKVPWYFIGLIHGMEASYNFRAHLHNGDFPLSSRTRQVPAGRPAVWLPPSDWESSAKDAIRLLGFANKTDWTLERTLHRLEAFNGFGYRKVGVPTPYLWSFSTHYAGGKFTSDGKFDAKAKSKQCGGAVLMKAMADAGAISLG